MEQYIPDDSSSQAVIQNRLYALIDFRWFSRDHDERKEKQRGLTGKLNIPVLVSALTLPHIPSFVPMSPFPLEGTA